jgi:hypothetical protein
MPFWNGLWKSVGSIYIRIMQMKKVEVPTPIVKSSLASFRRAISNKGYLTFDTLHQMPKIQELR